MKKFVEIYKYFFVHKFMSYGRYYICTNYSISVGKDNKYGHPNEEVLNILENSKIYRTDQYGSIIFIIKIDRLNIETYSSWKSQIS